MIGRTVWGALACSLALAASPLFAVSNNELKKYGFGDNLEQALDESRQLEPPKVEPSRKAIPSPVIPGLSEERQLPRPTGFENRTISQAYPRKAQSFEGPTEPYRGKDARKEERGFEDVEDFLFAPRQVHARMFSLSQRGLTGLGVTVSAEVPEKGTFQFRTGVDYTTYKRSFGAPLLSNQKITQYVFPFAYAFVPAHDLEVSLQYSIVDETGRNFPLLKDFDTFGLMDVAGVTKYRFYDNPETKVSLAATLGMRNGAKRLVTRFGSNGVDYLGSFNATKRLRNFGIHGEFGAVFVNGLDRSNAGVPDITFYNLGVDLQASRKLDLVVELNGLDWQSNGDNADAAAGFKLKLNRNWLVDLNGAINLHSTIPQGYRAHIYGGLQIQF
ncbi:MAG: hypothetical protein HY303_10395 [Candidatus Wallbacteria bacterium]|nr:hypothetical protein [Candidatus Wallbacteria bacterium]